ncbi:MAG: hypothetical protein V4537_13130 [Pseudomonadota bacterium]
MVVCDRSAIHGDYAAGDGDFTAALTTDGVLDIAIRGVWTVQQVDRFFSAIMPLYHQSRAQFGTVRALILVQTVQSPTVALHVRDRTLALKMVGDRNAVVVASFLSKLQITRLATTENFGVFTDAGIAREWLLAP